jgi:hypothetical protein
MFASHYLGLESKHDRCVKNCQNHISQISQKSLYVGYISVVKRIEAGTSEVWLRDFWPGEDITKNFLVSLFSEISISKKHVIITSVFLKRRIFRDKIFPRLLRKFFRIYKIHLQQKSLYDLQDPVKGTDIKNIWFTGENRRPPNGNVWDATLSFETDSSLRRNIYLPLWVTRMGDTLTEAQNNIDKLMMPRTLKFEKMGSVCAVVSNPEPMRLNFITEASKNFDIELFGLVFKKPVKSKSDVMNKSLFNICFENDLYPGYVTEKVFESWQCESIPVWWGLDFAEYLNPEAFLNVASLGIDATIAQMKYLLENKDAANLMRSQPILKKRYDIYQIVKKLETLIG